jgi:hypothetical protein
MELGTGKEKCTCQRSLMRSDRTDQKCPHCQNIVRRETKRENNYRTHGVGMTAASRAYHRSTTNG